MKYVVEQVSEDMFRTKRLTIKPAYLEIFDQIPLPILRNEILLAMYIQSLKKESKYGDISDRRIKMSQNDYAAYLSMYLILDARLPKSNRVAIGTKSSRFRDLIDLQLMPYSKRFNNYVNHERQHAKSAGSNGWLSYFTVLVSAEEIVEFGHVAIPSHPLTDLEKLCNIMIGIASAPDEPSEKDIRKVEHLKKLQEGYIDGLLVEGSVLKYLTPIQQQVL